MIDLNRSDVHCEFERDVNPELFAFVPLMKDNEKASVLRADPWLRTLFGSFIAGSLIWGTTVKFFIYSYLRNKKKIFDKPLNVLALVDLVLNHSFAAIYGVYWLVVLYSNKTITAVVKEQLDWPQMDDKVGECDLSRSESNRAR